jgi:SAM-dependent methyltransferase
MLSRLLARLKSPLASPAGPQLASVNELESEEFQSFMKDCNRFATDHGLRTLTNWSKVWEYPWLYHHGMSEINWKGKQLLDFGSEISPMPWWLATRGARVTLIETDRQWLPVWETLRRKLGVDVSWHFVDSDRLPVVDLSVDAVTSFSVIEHQRDKKVAVDEIARVLRPGGPLFISFDICEPELGMTFPAWNGRASGVIPLSATTSHSIGTEKTLPPSNRGICRALRITTTSAALRFSSNREYKTLSIKELRD